MSRVSWMALVPLAEGRLPEFEHARTFHRHHWSQWSPLEMSQQTASLVTYRAGDATGTYAVLPHPIPWSQLEGPCAVAWYWPNAAELLRHHPYHLLIAQVDEGRRTVQACLRFTSIVASLVESSAALGVLWGPASKVHEPGAFVTVAQQMSQEHLPLDLWVDFRIEQIADRQLRMFTTGLSVFGYPELEVAHYSGTVEELFGHAYNVAHMQLDKETTIRDGDTFGITDEVLATARVGPSMLDPAQEVTHLTFDEE